MEEYFIIVLVKVIKWNNSRLFFQLPPESLKICKEKTHSGLCVFIVNENGLLLCGSRIERHLRVLQLLM